jgi:CubicO group peptidase (beta-lactamase class C family)
MARRGRYVHLLLAVPLLALLPASSVWPPAGAVVGTTSTPGTSVTTTPALSDDVDAYVEDEMRRLHMPGLAVVVIVDGQVVHAEGYGVADADGRAVTTATPFVIGSTSKQLTGLAVQQLVADGRVGLDDPLHDYVPEFGDAEDKSLITVRDLLGHTSGFTTAQGQAGFAVDDRPDDTLERRALWLAAQPLAHPPGTAFAYSNANYDLLGRVVEVAAGVPFEQHLADSVVEPLGLEVTTTTREAALADGVAAAWYRWFGVVTLPTPMPYPRSAVPSTFLTSSADDLARVALAHVSRSDAARPGGIDDAVLEAAREPTSRYDEYFQYASGWWVHPFWPALPPDADVDDAAAPTAWTHDGNTPASSSYVTVVPETGFALVAVSNASYGVDGSDWPAFADGLVRTAVGAEPLPAAEPDAWSVLENRHLLMVAVPVLQAATLLLAARSRRRLLVLPAVLMAVVGLGLSYLYVPTVTDATLWVTWRSAPDVGIMAAVVTGLALLLLMVLGRRARPRRRQEAGPEPVAAPGD